MTPEVMMKVKKFKGKQQRKFAGKEEMCTFNVGGGGSAPDGWQPATSNCLAGNHHAGNLVAGNQLAGNVIKAIWVFWMGRSLRYCRRYWIALITALTFCLFCYRLAVYCN